MTNALAAADDRASNVEPISPDPMVQMIERIALNADLPIERMNAILDLRERQMAKEAEQSFNAAFAAAMAEMPDVPRTGHNKHLGNRYSTLDDLIRTSRPVLARHGLSLNWQTTFSDGAYSVKAIVRHSLGHQIETCLSGQRDAGKQMNALQGGGSTETYLKRYTGFSILGLSSGDERDDDGEGAGGTITAEQYQSLRELLEKSGGDEARLLAFFKLDHLEAMPSKDYARADAMLRQKVARVEAEANE